MLNPIACMTSGYPDANLERVLDGIAKAGFRYVELVTGRPRPPVDADNLSESQVKEARRLFANAGIIPISMAGHTDLIAPDGVERFRKRLDLAAAIGARIVNTGCGHTQTAEDEERFFQVMPQLIKHAERNGIMIAFETHGGLTGSGAVARRTVERLGSPLVKINYDTANVIFYQNVRPEEDVEVAAPYVGHVHLKDKLGGQGDHTFPPLGDGDIDFPRVVKTLAASGYLGPYSVEMEDGGVRSPEEEDAFRARLYKFVSELLAG